MLGPYRVAPIHRRVRGIESRGYFRSDFEDAFGRYTQTSVTSVTSVTPTLFTEESEPEPVTGVTGVTVVRGPSAAPTVHCADYHAHQASHRRDGDGWLCAVCSGGTT